MRHILVILMGLLAVAAAVTGCSAVGCTENRNSVPLAGFYSMSTGEPISVDSLAIGGVGAPADTLLLKPSARGTQVYLPFRSTASETEFYIRYEQKALNFPELFDTLKFTYTSVPYFASEDCGAMYHYNITSLTYTRHLIDSVGIVDSLITNLDIERLHIYFRTAQPDEPDEDENDTL